MKVTGFVSAMALALALVAPPLAEAGHRHGPGCGHRSYRPAPRYSDRHHHGLGCHHSAPYRPSARGYYGGGYHGPGGYYGGGYYGGGYYGGSYYGGGYYGYRPVPPPPPPPVYGRPSIGIYLRF
jgi:hypothetical protein